MIDRELLEECLGRCEIDPEALEELLSQCEGGEEIDEALLAGNCPGRAVWIADAATRP